ncbi:hypothetical protein FXO38_24631 [Capsicum annuum]|nr:hypothetical protein FXO38_24631 [Capsicum annuum]KAF3683564.1 hypothetical protein FXO37_01768 [Capsicum annuum]
MISYPFPNLCYNLEKALRDIQPNVFLVVAIENKGKHMEWHTGDGKKRSEISLKEIKIGRVSAKTGKAGAGIKPLLSQSRSEGHDCDQPKSVKNSDHDGFTAITEEIVMKQKIAQRQDHKSTSDDGSQQAGRLDDKKYFIDCNDAGADFIVAQGHGYNFSEYVETPKMEKLRDFLPKVEKDDDDDDDDYDDVLLAAQEKLDALKKSASSGSQEKDPTRVEALSTFIWEETWKLNKDSNKKMFVHAVN